MIESFRVCPIRPAPARKATRRWARLLLACACIFPGLSSAVHPDDRPGPAAVWVVEYENDIFSGEDRFYSSGIQLSRIAEARSPPSWLESVARRFPGFSDAETLPYRLSINHNIFTPRDIENPVLPPEDRPYAAWLNVQFATGTLHRRGADRVRVGLGVVGPAALGKQVQRTVHSAIDAPKPVGWDTQIRNEPTLQVGYDRLRRFASMGVGGGGFDASWFGGLALGNAHTHVSAGGFMRAGYDLPEAYGPPRISPAISGSGYFSPRPGRSWYAYAGIEGRRIFRNMMLEGNTFGGTDGVSIERRVGEIFAGVVYTHGVFRVAYTHVWRSPEFITQKTGQNYGALSFSLWW